MYEIEETYDDAIASEYVAADKGIYDFLRKHSYECESLEKKTGVEDIKSYFCN